MKFCFSIDALSPAGDKAWRLQDDNTWRACLYAESLKGSDAHIAEQTVAQDWAGRRMQKDKDVGLIAKNKAGMFDILMRGIYAHAVLHRLSAPALPDKTQMIEKLASLEVGTAWLLYLNIAGQFEALDVNQDKIIHNLSIAVRGEIASSAEYIGEKAAQNTDLMDSTYHQFLGGWVEHLNTSNMGVFVPDVEKLQPIEEYEQAILDWQHH